MDYLKVEWIHGFEEEPVEILSELDGQRNETRKVERFRNGVMTFAGPEGATGTTLLSENSLPPLDEISQDSEFRPSVINKQTFERCWMAATTAAAA